MYRRQSRRLAVLGLALIGALAGGLPVASASGLTPQSPTVLAAAEKGAKFLASAVTKDDRIGAQALIGLAISMQTGKTDHPRILECARNIQKALGDRRQGPGGAYGHWEGPIYSAGLAIVFLVQLDGLKANGPHHGDISTLLEYLHSQQKGHGGWGYPERTSGDTSMTQYGVLSAWEAKRAGFSVSLSSMERAANWLLSTQDPSGGYGYQGELGEPANLVPQSSVKHSMTAAGLGSLFICDHFFNLTAEARKPPKNEKVPPGLKEIKPDKGAQESKPRIDPQLVQDAEDRGNGWFDANFKVEVPAYNYYYLFAYEKYRTFRDKVEHADDRNPQWYSDAAEYVLSKQKQDGSWETAGTGGCGQAPDTAFAVLFLLRSTRRIFTALETLPDGTMVGGRTIPRDTGGTTADPWEELRKALEKALEDEENEEPAKLVTPSIPLPKDELERLAVEHPAAIRKLVSNKEASIRMAAVRLLCKLPRDLDNVPVLIHALSDPEVDIAYEANEGLRRIARSSSEPNPARRSPSDIRLSPAASDEERRAAIEKWSAWYRSIRPGAL